MGKKSVPAGRRFKCPSRGQRGAALLIFLVIIVLAALTYLVGGFGPDFSQASRERRTQEAMAQARDALIGYALQYREDQRKTGTLDAMYGYLPMPDVGTTRFHAMQTPACNIEGCAMSFVNGAFPSDTETIIGRLPWRTLGLGPIRDGHGECLWYAVSANHKSLGISSAIPMNWDTLGHLDVVVANTGTTLVSALANAHERPIVVIFSPGPSLPGQDRSPPPSPPPVGDDVTECGGNYNVANYLDPANAAALGGVTNYFPDPDPLRNNASGATGDALLINDPDPPKELSPRGKVFASAGGALRPYACQGTNCTLVANDKGLELTGDVLFGAIRKHAYFRTDINSMLDSMTGCLRDEIAGGGGPPAGYARIADNACYGTGVVPLGYYPNYRDQIFVARGGMTVNGTSCPAALLFANQRATGQLRQSNDNRTGFGYSLNYLEGINQTNFGAGTTFSGQELFERVSTTQTQFQDIVRCIPSTPSLVTSISPGLAAAGLLQLANYSPATRTLTLGQPVVGTPLDGSVSNFLYGCAWGPETHTLGGGLRSYFTFRINDAGGATWPTLGFTFTVADGDNNDIDLVTGRHACGAAAQHLGYSGNNTESPFIVPPKIGFEVDPRRETGFNPTLADHLLNGRNDPASPTYRGGHVAIDYWGGETAINTTLAPPCTAPAFDSGGICYLPPEEDDNVHAQPALARTGFPPPPTNPAVPATELSVPPDSPAGVYKLDPTLTSTPVSPNFFHVRAELTRTTYTRVATTANLDLNIPGNPVNGVTLVAGDGVWVRYQTVSADNGLYVWNGATVPMTRIADGESSSNFSLPRVRVATTAPIVLSTPGDSVDNVFLFAGDRILVKNQAAPGQNGIYVWNAPSLPLIRAADAATAADLTGLVVEVQQGAQNARGIWRQNTKFPITCPPSDPIACNNDIGWTNLRVKLTAPSTTNLASPGAALDGIRMKPGDRVYVKNLGIFIWNGAVVPMTPATDIVSGSIVQIQQGSEATAWWLYDGAGWQRLSVRVASRANLDLASPGGTIDGVALVAGDRVLVKDQTSSVENGIYQWNGAAVAMTRAPDANSALGLAGALTQALAGSSVGRAFRQSALAANGTLGTNAVQWSAIDRSTSYLLEIWILLDSPSLTSKIAAMKDTTRSMRLLYPEFTPHLQDRPVIPYSFRNARLGFTIGQRTSVNDQTISISNSFTTWLE